MRLIAGQNEAISLLAYMKSVAEDVCPKLERKAHADYLTAQIDSGISKLQTAPISMGDIEKAGEEIVECKDTIEALLRRSRKADNPALANEVLKLVMGFNACAALLDLMQLIEGKDHEAKRRKNPGPDLDDLMRHLFGDGRD